MVKQQTQPIRKFNPNTFSVRIYIDPIYSNWRCVIGFDFPVYLNGNLIRTDSR